MGKLPKAIRERLNKEGRDRDAAKAAEDPAMAIHRRLTRLTGRCDVLNLSDPGDLNIELKLVNSRGFLVSDSFELPLRYSGQKTPK
jgi:hypothetical protein